MNFPSLRNSVLIANRLQQVILSVIGVPGALLAGWMVEMPYLGRKGTLAVSTRRPLYPLAETTQTYSG